MIQLKVHRFWQIGRRYAVGYWRASPWRKSWKNRIMALE
jgi:hypothetical protein